MGPVTFGFAQSVSAPTNAPAATIRVTTRTVYIDVVVKDRGGKIVYGLTQDDFKLTRGWQAADDRLLYCA